MHKKELKALDKLFSDYVRQRAVSRVHGCERCLQGKTSYKQLHCAHMHPRRKRSVRWDIDNAIGICPGCHRHIDNDASVKVAFFRNLLGDRAYDLLEMRANTPQRVDVNAIYLYLKNLLKEE